ncbi:MAG: hypothetical protein LW688_03595 [Cryomorphaceae bacterium]|jgi:hypothetical protein|nr:hypothetical protein [Cryomorphaceae bacterium]
MNVLLRLLVRSSHQEGDSVQNEIRVTIPEEQLSGIDSEINWIALNASLMNESSIELIRSTLLENRIEVPDPNYWTTEVYAIGVGDMKMPEDFDLYLIEDRIMTGDLL